MNETDEKYVSSMARLILRSWKDVRQLKDEDDFIFEKKRTCSWLSAYKVMNVNLIGVISFKVFQKVDKVLDRTIRRIQRIQFRGQVAENAEIA